MAVARKHRTTLVHRHLALPLEAALVVSGGVSVAVGAPALASWLLMVWMIIAIGYIVVAVRTLVRAVASPELNEIMLPTDGPHTGAWGRSFHLDVIVIGMASTMGIAAAIVVSVDADAISHPALSRLEAAASIVLAWALLQFGFARLYADYWFRENGGGGLQFPASDRPGLVEFTFFAFGIGTAFQNSDVVVTTSHMRMIVTIHSISAFLYGSVLIAFLVSLIPLA